MVLKFKNPANELVSNDLMIFKKKVPICSRIMMSIFIILIYCIFIIACISSFDGFGPIHSYNSQSEKIKNALQKNTLFISLLILFASAFYVSYQIEIYPTLRNYIQEFLF